MSCSTVPTRSAPAAPSGADTPDAAAHAACGWFESSHVLLSGLSVEELDAAPPPLEATELTPAARPDVPPPFTER